MVLGHAQWRPDEVEEGEEEDPDDVHEVPVEPHDLDRGVVLGAVGAPPRQERDPQDDRHADDHVERVEAGHPEVEREVDLRVAALGALQVEGGGVEALAGDEAPGVRPVAEAGADLVAVLEVLHPEEDAAEEDGREQEPDDPALLPDRREVDGHRHGEAGADQDERVGEADLPAEVVAARGEGRRVHGAVDRVRREEPAEEEHLLGDEDPHPEGDGLLLLPQVGEVVLEGRVVGARLRQRRPPSAPSRSRRAPRSPPGPRGSSRWAAARWSSTRGPWRPRGCRPRARP